jgi:hypothetical protein
MLDKALAVKTLAGCEKSLSEWAELARMCRELDDDHGERIALQVVDPLLDLRAVLTEHIETAKIAA